MTNYFRLLNDAIDSSFELVMNTMSTSTTSAETNKIDEKQVKYSCYLKPKLYCQGENGTISFFNVWTLFVIWIDDTVDYWFKAEDVNNGIGFQQENAIFHTTTYTSEEESIILWQDISKLLYASCVNFSNLEQTKLNNNSEEENDERGISDSRHNVERTPFLTEKGLYKVYQFAPECKLFSRSIVEYLKFIRQQVVGNQMVESNEYEFDSVVGEETVVKRCLTDNERAEYDDQIAALNDKLTKMQNEYERREHHMKSRLNEDWLNKEQQTAAKSKCTSKIALEEYTAREENITSEYDALFNVLNGDVTRVQEEFRTREKRLLDEFNSRVTELEENLSKKQREFREKEERMHKHLKSKTIEIVDLYEHNTLLQDEIRVLQDDVNERKFYSFCVTERYVAATTEVDELKKKVDRLTAVAARKREQFDQLRRCIKSFRKICLSPRNILYAVWRVINRQRRAARRVLSVTSNRRTAMRFSL